MNINELESEYRNILQQLIKEKPLSFFNLLRSNKKENIKYKEIGDYLIIKYPQLKNHTFSEYCYWFINNLNDFPKCKNSNCNNILKYNNMIKPYHTYCCLKCAASDQTVKDKHIETSLKKYNTKHPSQSDIIKQKICDNNMKKYGSKYYYQTDIFKEKSKKTKLERYNNENYNNHLKCSQTKLERYNDENYNNIKKNKLTKFKRYGDENYNNREKAKNTCIIKYNVEHPMLLKETVDKIRITSIEKSGFDWPNKTLEVQNKIKNTNLLRYGVENVFQSPLVQKIIEKTNLDKYGTIIPSQNDKIAQKISIKLNNRSIEEKQHTQKLFKETCQSRYSVDHYSKTAEYKEKCIKTNNERYNVDFYSQTIDCRQKSSKKYLLYFNDKQLKLNLSNIEQINNYFIVRKNNSNKKIIEELNIKLNNAIQFDSKWEIKVYLYCKEHNIDVTYQPNISFEYFLNNEKYLYFPDFLINNQLYEVKGNHFFKTDNNGNLKMICPFRKKEWSDNDYLNICNKYHAKYECMLKNNIIILKNYEIANLEKTLQIV